MDMCRFRDQQDPGYLKVVEALKTETESKSSSRDYETLLTRVQQRTNYAEKAGTVS
jgi:hypothetical protein